VFPNVEIRHLHAVIALAEELNFTRAADRLHITQPALSKQITDLEAEHRFHLFTRHKRRVVELTDAGRVFVEEARSALSHTERAVHFARAAHDGSDSILTIGHSPYANHDWVSAMLAIRLPLYPRLGIRLKTQFAMESVHSVLVGEVNLALVTAPPQDAQITAVPLASAPLSAALPETTPLLTKNAWFSRIWQRTSGFCLRNGFIHSCMRRLWIQPDVSPSPPNMLTMSLRRRRQWT
jgi:DNA-binding transcriptional LysR family regulator